MPPKKGAKKKAISKKATPKKQPTTPNNFRSETDESDVSADKTNSEHQISLHDENTSQNLMAVERDKDEDYLLFYARKYWSIELNGAGEFKDEVVEEIFNKELSGNLNLARLNMLETSSYLENYLWSNMTTGSSFEHIFSIVLMINEKCREGSPVFDHLTENNDKFSCFYNRCIALSPPLGSTLSTQQQTNLLVFFINIYQSLENGAVRQCALRYLSLPIWQSLTHERLQMELDANPQLRRHWLHHMNSASESMGSEYLGDNDEVVPASKTASKRGRSASKIKEEADRKSVV